jgi:hypothetical protein
VNREIIGANWKAGQLPSHPAIARYGKNTTLDLVEYIPRNWYSFDVTASPPDITEDEAKTVTLSAKEYAALMARLERLEQLEEHYRAFEKQTWDTLSNLWDSSIRHTDADIYTDERLSLLESKVCPEMHRDLDRIAGIVPLSSPLGENALDRRATPPDPTSDDPKK